MRVSAVEAKAVEMERLANVHSKTVRVLVY